MMDKMDKFGAALLVYAVFMCCVLLTFVAVLVGRFIVWGG